MFNDNTWNLLFENIVTRFAESDYGIIASLWGDFTIFSIYYLSRIDKDKIKALFDCLCKEETAELLRKTNQIYRDLLRRADDIGKDNPMASNLYEGLIFLALWDASDRKISVEELRTISEEMMSFPLLKAMGLMINANKKSGMARIAKMMHKDAAWLEAHPQYKAYSWDFHFDETKHQDGFYYHFTQCPLNTFARKEGYLEVLPIMCDIDYKTAALMHAKLYRDHTLAGSGEVCDYWFVGDKVENPK